MVPTHIIPSGVEQPVVTGKSLSMRHSVPAFCQVLPSARNLPRLHLTRFRSPIPQICSPFCPDCSRNQCDGLIPYHPSYFCALFRGQVSPTYSTILCTASTGHHHSEAPFSRSQRRKYTCLCQTLVT